MSGSGTKDCAVESISAVEKKRSDLHELVCTLMFGINPPPCGLELIYDAYLAQKKETI